MSARRANARIEVLVWISLGLILAGMVTVGISKLRETANSKSCENNLKQLVLSVANYESSFNRLPRLTDEGDVVPGNRHLASVFVRLAPFIESGYSVYLIHREAKFYHSHSSVNWTFPLQKMPGETITIHGGQANWPWTVMIDPGDWTGSKLVDVEVQLPDGTTGYYATGSYAVNGVLPWGKSGAIASAERASRSVVVFGERPQVCETAGGDKVFNLWGIGFYSPQMPTFAQLAPTDPSSAFSTGQATPVLPLPEENAVGPDTALQIKIGRVNATPQRVDFTTPFQHTLTKVACDPRLPGGLHRDGYLCGMSDASVRTFSWSTDARVFWQACTPVAVNDGN